MDFIIYGMQFQSDAWMFGSATIKLKAEIHSLPINCNSETRGRMIFDGVSAE